MSRLNNCNHCSRSHGCDVDIFGGSAEVLDLAVVDLDAAPMDNKLREMLRFIPKIVSSPDEFGQVDWRKALNAGWERAKLEAAMYQAGQFQFMNTIAIGNIIPATPLEIAMDLTRERHGEKGYGAIVDMIEKLTRTDVEVSVTVSQRQPQAG